MKKIILTLFLLIFTVMSYSQTLNPPSSTVGVGFGVEKGTTIVVDSLDFPDGWILLLQDNATLIIREKVNGNAVFRYGDVGDTIPKSELVELPQSLNGVPYSDWRNATDVNPKIIFEKCIDPTNLFFGPYVDYEIPVAPTILIASTETLLTCLNTEISITSTVSTIGQATYLWSTGETTADIAVASEGTYFVTVTDGANGCPVKSNEIVITQDVNVPIADAGGPKSITCNDAVVVLGTVSTDTTLTYEWNTGETTAQISVSNPGTYTLTVTNVNGCSAADTVVVDENLSPPAITLTSDLAEFTCGVDQVVITSNVGVGTYTYAWDTGDLTKNIIVTQSGIYTVVITDVDSGCINTASITIGQSSDSAIAADDGDKELCNGSAVTLIASGGNTILWDNGETTFEISVNPTVTTTFGYTVTSGACTDSGEVIVTVYEPPIADAGLDVDMYPGENRTLTAQGGGTYVWSNGETTQSIIVSPTTTTTYTVTVTNGICSDTDDVIVTVLTPPSIVANAGNDRTILLGDNVILTANGSNEAVYLWSTGETTKSISVSPTVATIYTVTVNEQGGNFESDSEMIRVNQN